MDGQHFDAFARALAAGVTRRQVVRSLAAGLAAAFAGGRAQNVAAQCDPSPCPDGQQRDPATCYCFDATCPENSGCRRGGAETCCSTVPGGGSWMTCCREGSTCCPGVTADGKAAVRCCPHGFACAGGNSGPQGVSCTQLRCADPTDCPEGFECCRGYCWAGTFREPCPPPQQRDPATCGCVCPPVTCPGRQVLNRTTCQCECRGPARDCLDPSVFNPTTCACEDCAAGTEFCAGSQVCEPACTAGRVRNQTTCDCECPTGQVPCGPAGSKSCVPSCDPATGAVLDDETCTCRCPEGSESCGSHCVACPSGSVPDPTNTCACTPLCPDAGSCPVGQSPDPSNGCQCTCGPKGTFCREGDRGAGSPAGCEQCPGDMVPIENQYCACTCPPGSNQPGFCTVDYRCCRADQACVNAQCVCPESATECGGVCVPCPVGQSPDPANNCACGGSPCPIGQTPCNGACIGLLNDRRNCGVCGNTCGFNETCSNGVCVCPGGVHLTAGTPCTSHGSCCSGFCDQGVCSHCLGNPLHHACGELCCTEASCGGTCMAPCQIPGNSPDTC